MNINKLFILIVCLVSFASCNSPELQQASNLIGDSNNLTNPSLPPVVNEYTKIFQAGKATVGIKQDGSASCIHSSSFCTALVGKTNIKKIVSSVRKNSYFIIYNDDTTECYGNDTSRYNPAACVKSNVKDVLMGYEMFVIHFNDGTVECSSGISNCPSGNYDQVRNHASSEVIGELFSGFTVAGDLTIFGDSAFDFTSTTYTNVKDYDLSGQGSYAILKNDNTFSCNLGDWGTSVFSCSSNALLTSNIQAFYFNHDNNNARSPYPTQLVLVKSNGDVIDSNLNGGITTTHAGVFSLAEVTPIEKIKVLNYKTFSYNSSSQALGVLDSQNSFSKSALASGSNMLQSLGRERGYLTLQNSVITSYVAYNPANTSEMPQQFLDGLSNMSLMQVLSNNIIDINHYNDGIVALTNRNTVASYDTSTDFWFEQKLNY